MSVDVITFPDYNLLVNRILEVEEENFPTNMIKGYLYSDLIECTIFTKDTL